MTAIQIYEQAIKPLPDDKKLVIVRLIINEVVPAPEPVPGYIAIENEESGFEYLKRLLPHIECITLTQQDLNSVMLR